MKRYAVYVADDNGWSMDCPDSEGVFFGDHDGEFVRHVYEIEGLAPQVDLGSEGCVLFDAEDQARALLAELESGGDWKTDDGERRPVYAMREIEVAEDAPTEEQSEAQDIATEDATP